jgi:acetolactate synthase-1/2/3 large subunit
MNKPVILIGAGCPQSLADKLSRLGIPVLTTWQAIDRVPETSPVFCGRPGMIGQRAANIIQQKADLLIVVGARLDTEQVGYRIDNFAPGAQKVVYDIDRAELDKLPKSFDKRIADLNRVYEAGLFFEKEFSLLKNSAWLRWCKNLYEQFRPELDGENISGDYVDPYFFMRHLSQECAEGEVIVPGSSGTQSCVLMQSFKVKQGQKILLCNTTGAMGFDVPMAIGAALCTGQRVICVTGDGGFMLNFQELEVVSRLNLPVKFFVFCNDGYGSIASMQDGRFDGHRVGSNAISGFTIPRLPRIAAVWGMAYHYMGDNCDVAESLGRIMAAPGAAIIHVNTSLDFRYACRVSTSIAKGIFRTDDMQEMTPKLDPVELAEIMVWGNE